jgi:hypothetical protein
VSANQLEVGSDFKISMTGVACVFPRLKYSVTGERTNEVNLDQGALAF